MSSDVQSSCGGAATAPSALQAALKPAADKITALGLALYGDGLGWVHGDLLKTYLHAAPGLSATFRGIHPGKLSFKHQITPEGLIAFIRIVSHVCVDFRQVSHWSAHLNLTTQHIYLLPTYLEDGPLMSFMTFLSSIGLFDLDLSSDMPIYYSKNSSFLTVLIQINEPISMQERAVMRQEFHRFLDLVPVSCSPSRDRLLAALPG